MPQKLSIAPAQVQADNNSESLLNESSDKWSNLAHLTQAINFFYKISNILEFFLYSKD